MVSLAIIELRGARNTEQNIKKNWKKETTNHRDQETNCKLKTGQGKSIRSGPRWSITLRPSGRAMPSGFHLANFEETRVSRKLKTILAR